MASYKGVNGTLVALEEFFKRRLPVDLSAQPVNARVSLLGSADVAKPITGNVLGIYLHRLTVDPHGRNRFFSARGSDQNGPAPELPVNLHFLLIAAGSSATIEADLISWAMLELANDGQLDISHLSPVDDNWGDRELLNIVPEEMSTEDLMRIWDVFETPYTVTVPYIARTVRLRLKTPATIGPAVVTRVLPGGSP